MDAAINRTLATRNHSTRLHNSIYITTATTPQSNTNHSVQQTTTATTSTRNQTTIKQRSNRTCQLNNTRLLQQYVRDPKTQWRLQASLQPQTTESVHSSSALQNGNLARGDQIDQTHQLHDIHRSFRRLFTHSSSSRLEEILTNELARNNVSVLHNPFWTVSRSLAFHQAHTTDSRVGTVTEHSVERVPGRLAANCQQSPTSPTSNSTGSQQTAVIRMASQSNQVTTESITNHRTPRLRLGYDNNDRTNSWQEIEGSSKKHTANLEETDTNSQSHPQPHNENSSSHLRVSTSTTLHSAPTQTEESNGTYQKRLGLSTTINNRMHPGTPMVEGQHQALERQEHSSSNPTTNNICRRQQQWLGMQHSTQPPIKNSIRSLDPPRSNHVDQLERTESSILSIEDVSPPQQHAHIDQNRQHNVDVLYEQTGRNEITTTNDISNKSMEMVSTTRNNYSSITYSGPPQYHRRLRVETAIPEEQLDDPPQRLPTNTTTSRTKRRRSICRPVDETATKIRLLVTRSGEYVRRRVYNTMEPVQPAISEPTMEPHQQMPTQITSGESTASNHDYTLVDVCPLVPDNSVNEPSTSIVTNSGSNSTTIPRVNMADEKQRLEARRMEIIRSKFGSSQLNGNARQVLLTKYTADNATNRSYRPGQLHFLKWCEDNKVSPILYTPIDLINFLSDMHTQYSLATIQLYRSAVTHLHQHPQHLRDDINVNNFITTLLNQAPPKRLHRPNINLQPTFDHLRKLDNSVASFGTLQRKLAFLLAVTCFLRPSDLNRIPYSSVTLSQNDTLVSFEVHCPKEKRARQRIIKPFQVKAHNDTRLCPIAVLLALQRRRRASIVDHLFIYSRTTKTPEVPLKPRTIRGWLKQFLQHSTDEPKISIRSVASSLALAAGIPREDIVTMGNWLSSTTFENHYRRDHLTRFDFTNTLIQPSIESDDDTEDNEEEYFDAEDLTMKINSG